MARGQETMLSRREGADQRPAKAILMSHRDCGARPLGRPESKRDHAADPSSFDRLAHRATVCPENQSTRDRHYGSAAPRQSGVSGSDWPPIQISWEAGLVTPLGVLIDRVL